MNNESMLLLEFIYEACGGACSECQVLMMDEVYPETIDDLIEQGYIRRHIVDDKSFLICRHAVYRLAGNANQNYRLTTYNLKKSCLLAEYWLNISISLKDIVSRLQCSTMHQRTLGPWDDYMSYLHSQDCYAQPLTPTDGIRYFVWFPRSQDPLTIAKWIRKFFDEQGRFDDGMEVTPYLGVRVADTRLIPAILKRIDGRYWWIRDRLCLFEMNCPDTRNLI